MLTSTEKISLLRLLNDSSEVAEMFPVKKGSKKKLPFNKFVKGMKGKKGKLKPSVVAKYK